MHRWRWPIPMSLELSVKFRPWRPTGNALLEPSGRHRSTGNPSSTMISQASEAGGIQGSNTPSIYVGDIDMYTPLENLIPSHANCMQHILRCRERQSDCSEYKKTLRRPGLRPGSRWGSLQRSCKPLAVGRGSCHLPNNLALPPALGPSVLACPTPLRN